MLLVLFSIAILLLSSLFSLLFAGEKRLTACVGTAIASVIGVSGSILASGSQDLFFKTAIPDLIISVGIDPLSRFFLIVIFGLSFFTAIYGFGYIKEQKKFLNTLPFFPLLVASMVAVTISRDGLSFIVFWEIMSLSSYFLVVSEHENRDVQNAGWIYLIATHLATAFLMAFFVLLAKESGSLLFKDFAFGAQSIAPSLAGILFVFALIGFGTKAGLFPVHLWLPHAHPAAPSYISALMSGVMIKTGIYGIMRALMFLGRPFAWWGIVLILIGVLSAVIGVLYALMQNDLKRLLAYCSVENIGIAAIGLGLGLIGMASGNITVSALGFGGALFHVLNHSIFKGLLFFGAGNIAHGAHTLLIDELGGLLKKLPLTGITFLIAALSICGLPPFNGFISEWLIYIGLFQGTFSLGGYPILVLAIAVIGIAFAGGLAVICFTKVFGIVFLGEPRKIDLNECHESPKLMLAPMFALAFLCVLIGLFPKIIWAIAFGAAETIYPAISEAQTFAILSSLNYISMMFALVIMTASILFFLRALISRKRPESMAVTWDCGFEFPGARMQYSASSFVEPITAFFKPALNLAALDIAEDLSEKKLFLPLFRKILDFIMFIRLKRKSSIQYYLILIFITLITLFIWEAWFGI
jgi:formate hydrogenlyase subunit 3/multisubunit Na+/H+ antiporter MnhD subunit